MTKKYRLTDEYIKFYGKKLYRIEALKNFSHIKKGDLGGFIEKEENLSHDGYCWVYDNAKVYDNARVFHNARVFDGAEIYDCALVYRNALVYDNAWVYGNARILDDVRVYGNAEVYDFATVLNNAEIYGNARVYENAEVYGDAKVYEDAQLSGYAKVSDYAKLLGSVLLSGNEHISGNAVVTCDSDYVVFKNNWSSVRYFIWTKSNDMWQVGFFHGTGEELIKKAYEDNEESGKKYEAYVKLVETLKD